MAGIIKTSINLSAIPKDKIIPGKKGQYLPITITVNDEVDMYGNQGPVIVSHSKEEREARIAADNQLQSNIDSININLIPEVQQAIEKIR